MLQVRFSTILWLSCCKSHIQHQKYSAWFQGTGSLRGFVACEYKVVMCLATGFALPYALCDAAHLATQKLLLFILKPTFLCGHSGLLFLCLKYCVKASMLLREFLNIMTKMTFCHKWNIYQGCCAHLRHPVASGSKYGIALAAVDYFPFLCWSIPVDLH